MKDKRLLTALRAERSKPTLRRESMLAPRPFPSKSTTATPMILDQSVCADTVAARNPSASPEMATVDPSVDASARLLIGTSPAPAKRKAAAVPVMVSETRGRNAAMANATDLVPYTPYGFL